MQESTKKNLPLYIGLAIPVLMIIAIAIAIYVPRIFAPQPQHGFLYLSAGNDIYFSQYSYSIRDGKLIRYANNNNYPNNTKPINFTEPQIYIYDAKTNQSKPISFEDAQNLHLDSSAISPDGFQVVNGNGGGGGIFFSAPNDYNSHYLKGHGLSRQLNLELTGNMDYYNNFQFLGWKIN